MRGDLRDGIITLTTDFGLSDSYVAQMKGVLLSICPEANLVDLTHSVPACDVITAARILAESIPLFPSGTTHLAVVDPGVGGNRRRLIVETEIKSEHDNQFKIFRLVGPDNGIFSVVVSKAQRTRVWEITKLEGLPKFPAGQTFDGRNVFAPVAALLSHGKSPADFGPEISGHADTRLADSSVFAAPVKVDGIIKGSVIYFDHFGNAATNISKTHIGRGKVLLSLPKLSLTLELRQNFEQFEPKQAGCIINSQGYVEIVINQGNARQLLGLAVGDGANLSFG